MSKLYIALFCTLPLTVSAAKTASLVWCLDHLPPRQHYVEGLAPTGPMVDMMQQVAAELNLELVFTLPTKVNRCLEQLQSGKADIVTGLLKTPEREEQLLLFSFDRARPESWFINSTFNNSTAVAAGSKPRSVTIIQGRHYTADFKQRYKAAGYKVEEVASLDDALARLYFKDTHIVVGPEHIIQAEINRNPRYRNVLHLSPQNLQQPIDAHAAISRYGRYASREEEFNEIFRKIRTGGHFKFYD